MSDTLWYDVFDTGKVGSGEISVRELTKTPIHDLSGIVVSIDTKFVHMNYELAIA